MENIMTFLILFLVYEIIKYIKKRRWAHPPSRQHQLKNKPTCQTDFGAISYKVKK